MSRRKPTLRFSIGLALVGVVVLTASVIIVNSWLSARSNAESAMTALTGLAGQQTAARIQAYLRPARDVARLVADRVERGELGFKDEKGLDLALFRMMDARPGTAVVALATPRGEWMMVKRMPDGSLDSKRIQIDAGGQRRVVWRDREPGQTVDQGTVREDPKDSYDPRIRPWYADAVSARKPVWSDVYVFWTDQRAGISASVPVIVDEEITGVVTVDVNLAQIASFVATLEVGKGGIAAIVDEQGRLISGPNPDELVIQSEDKSGSRFEPRPARESTEPAVAAIAGSPAFTEALSRGLSEPIQLRVETDQGPIVADLRAIELGRGHRWVVAVLLPEDAFLGPLRRTNSQNVWTSVAVALAALLLGSFITRRVAQSMAVLQRETRAIQQLAFEESTVESPFYEVDQVLKAFEHMKVGLRSFRKYVPVKLVRELLDKHVEPALGGEFMEITIYFSDMVGFASIAERMHPMEMAGRLGTYLGALTEEIDANQGTAVQYVGDEVMALWGAPQPVDNHAARACDGALACASRVLTLWDEGDTTPVFHTRFGLHTARVAVGHFGSEYRLYYGAIGDGINLASRLEGLNKFYGTDVLISDTTRDAIGDKYAVRRLDRVVVKGRESAIDVYELLGAADQVPAQRLEHATRYEKALDLYIAGRFEEATASFRAESDRASEVLLARCERYVADPPDDWAGAHIMTAK